MERFYLLTGQETPDEIARLLQDNCEGREEMTYAKNLTEEELHECREQLANNHIEIARHNEDLAEAKAAHKAAVKPLATENKDLLRTIKHRYTEKTEQVYKFPDHVNGMMVFVNNEGHVVGSRRLKPDEKQSSIFSISRAVNQ